MIKQVWPAHLALVRLRPQQVNLNRNLKVIAQALLAQVVKVIHNREARRKVNLRHLREHQMVVVGLLAEVKVLVGAFVAFGINVINLTINKFA